MKAMFAYWLLKVTGVMKIINDLNKDMEILETSTEFLINNYDKRLRWKLKRILTNTRSPFYFKKVKENNSHAQSAVKTA
jgi:hypothetical protein